MLRTLLTVPFRTAVNYNHPGTGDLAAITVLHDSLSRAIEPRARTPASEHFVNVLRPLAVGSVAEPDKTFDELEIWIGLAAADASLRLGRVRDFVPPGRFMWRATTPSQPTATFDEAASMGADWAPLRAGWFGGSINAFAAAKRHFEDKVAQMAPSFY